MESPAMKRGRATRLSAIRRRGPSFRFIVDRVRTYQPEADFDLIREACQFSAEVHRGQTRRSGKPFVVHPLNVSFLLAKMHMDAPSIAAGALHDSLEKTSISHTDIADRFGSDVAELVEGVSCFPLPGEPSKEERRARGFRKMILAAAADARVLPIKLADRLHNMRTLAAMPHQAQLRIAAETMNLYAPLADRLGISWISQELENLAFKYLQPKQYYALKTLCSRARSQTGTLEGHVTRALKTDLAGAGIQAVIKPENSGIVRLHRQMTAERAARRRIDVHVAVRVLVSEEPDCYAALAIIGRFWEMDVGSFRDFIANPKSNGHQSIEVTIVEPSQRGLIDLRIRTHQMQRFAERGIFSYWSPDRTPWQTKEYVDIITTMSCPDASTGDSAKHEKSTGPFARMSFREVPHHCSPA
jgi:guanosine-3',5'-bis(diphosphate) 3'-pyrophosphohydrolase